MSNNLLIDINKLFYDSINLFNDYFNYNIVKDKNNYDIINFYKNIIRNIKREDFGDQIIIYDIIYYISNINIEDELNSLYETMKLLLNNNKYNIIKILNSLDNNIKYNLIYNIMIYIINKFRDYKIILYFNNLYIKLKDDNKINLLDIDYLTPYCDFIIFLKNKFINLNKYIRMSSTNEINNFKQKNKYEEYNSSTYKLEEFTELEENNFMYNLINRYFNKKQNIDVNKIKNMFLTSHSFYIDYLLILITNYNNKMQEYNDIKLLIEDISKVTNKQIIDFYSNKIENIFEKLNKDYKKYLEYKKYVYNEYLLSNRYSLINIIKYIYILKDYIVDNYILLINLIIKKLKKICIFEKKQFFNFNYLTNIFNNIINNLS